MSQLRLLTRRNVQAGAALSIASSSAYLIKSAQDATTKTEADPSPPQKSHVGMIETDFTERLASKPYLNYHNPYSRHNIITSSINSSKRLWGKFARNDRNANASADDWKTDDASAGSLAMRTERPKGVPRRIRIMAIDVPEFREVFDGECRVNLSRVYPDDIAPPKYLPRKNERDVKKDDASAKNNKTEVEKLEIVQKSLARSLVRCRNKQSKRIGVELLEASVYDLNPNNMRRTYHFGSYKYDPGKYGSKNSPGGDMLQRRMSVTTGWGRLNLRRRKVFVTKDENSNEKEDEDKGYADVEESVQEGNMQEGGDMQEEDSVTEVTVLAEENDEVDAPWNQYAWIEEMQIRVSGAYSLTLKNC